MLGYDVRYTGGGARGRGGAHGVSGWRRRGNVIRACFGKWRFRAGNGASGLSVRVLGTVHLFSGNEQYGSACRPHSLSPFPRLPSGPAPGAGAACQGQPPHGAHGGGARRHTPGGRREGAGGGGEPAGGAGVGAYGAGQGLACRSKTCWLGRSRHLKAVAAMGLQQGMCQQR